MQHSDYDWLVRHTSSSSARVLCADWLFDGGRAPQDSALVLPNVIAHNPNAVIEALAA